MLGIMRHAEHWWLRNVFEDEFKDRGEWRPFLMVGGSKNAQQFNWNRRAQCTFMTHGKGQHMRASHGR